MGRGRDNELPFLDKVCDVGGREHIADTNNRKWRSGATDEADGVGNKARETNANEEDNQHKNNGENVGVGDGLKKHFEVEFFLEQENTIGEECNIKYNNKAAVGDDSLVAEGTGNDRVAQEGGVVENQTKLRLEAKIVRLHEFFVKEELGEEDEESHDDEAGNYPRKEKIGGVTVVARWKSGKERGWHEDGE